MITNCVLSRGKQRKDGYVVVKFRGRTDYAHRRAYVLSVGEIPTGLEVDHLCGVRNCINQNHLEAVTHTVNTRRQSLASRMRSRLNLKQYNLSPGKA